MASLPGGGPSQYRSAASPHPAVESEPQPLLQRPFDVNVRSQVQTAWIKPPVDVRVGVGLETGYNVVTS